MHIKKRLNPLSVSHTFNRIKSVKRKAIELTFLKLYSMMKLLLFARQHSAEYLHCRCQDFAGLASFLQMFLSAHLYVFIISAISFSIKRIIIAAYNKKGCFLKHPF